MSGRAGQIALACFAVALGASPQLRAADSALTIVGIRAGFAGHVKVGCWAPYEVTLEGGSAAVTGRVEITVADGDAVPSRVHGPRDPITIGPGETATVSLFAKIGQLKSDVVVDFRGDDGPLASRRFVPGQHESLAALLPSSRELIVTLGAPLTASDQAHFQQRNTTVANLDGVEGLPAEWWGYEGVDAVILATGDDEISSQLATAGPRMAALDLWVRMGGTLVMSVGRQAERVLASGSPLAALAPGTLTDIVPLRQSTAFETYAETSESISDGAFLLQVPRLGDVRGKIEAYAGNRPGDLPLVVRTAHGFGEVVLVAADFEQGPLANWVARPQLFDKLLHRSARPAADAQEGGLGQVTTLGFVDLSGQLRGALDQFAGVQLVPFWLVAVLILLYILCIGPLDYYIVKRLLGRMEATWVTFAITVLAFCAGAYLLTYGLKGRELLANQVDLVDFDAETRLVRGTTWLQLFSPDSAAYDLSLDVPRAAAALSASEPRSLFSWLGLPGDGFGGMNATAGSMPLFTAAYDFSTALDRVERVPIAVWSTKAFVGRWWAEGSGPIEAELGDNGRLFGSLACHLPAPLEDCVLIYGGWAYPLRQLKSGQKVDIGQLDPQTVETYLRHVTLQGDRDVAPPYDRASFDIPRIIEIMSCHELAGGESYTGLTHQFQEFVDLSGAVAGGRAILIGRQAKSAVGLVAGGQPLDNPSGAQWSFYRFVFPVKKEAGR